MTVPRLLRELNEQLAPLVGANAPDDLSVDLSAPAGDTVGETDADRLGLLVADALLAGDQSLLVDVEEVLREQRELTGSDHSTLMTVLAQIVREFRISADMKSSARIAETELGHRRSDIVGAYFRSQFQLGGAHRNQLFEESFQQMVDEVEEAEGAQAVVQLGLARSQLRAGSADAHRPWDVLNLSDVSSADLTLALLLWDLSLYGEAYERDIRAAFSASLPRILMVGTELLPSGQAPRTFETLRNLVERRLTEEAIPASTGHDSLAAIRALEVRQQVAEGHLDDIVDLTGSAGSIDQADPRLLIELASLSRSRGDLQTAQLHVVQALQVATADRDKEAEGFARTTHGVILRDLGQLAEARLELTRARDLKAELYGQDHPQYAITLSKLALVLRVIGDLDDARAMQQEALDLKESALPLEHPEIAKSYASLAQVSLGEGDYGKARALFQNALFLCEKSPVRPIAEQAVIRNKLSMLHLAEQHFDEALELCDLALVGKRRVYGDHHIEVGLSLATKVLILGEGRRGGSLTTAIDELITTAQAGSAKRPDDARWTLLIRFAKSASAREASDLSTSRDLWRRLGDSATPAGR